MAKSTGAPSPRAPSSPPPTRQRSPRLPRTGGVDGDVRDPCRRRWNASAAGGVPSAPHSVGCDHEPDLFGVVCGVKKCA